MRCSQCRNVFREIGNGINDQIDLTELLERTAKSLVEQFTLKGCHFRLLSRDQKILEGVASYGLSERFLGKGPVDAEKSVSEALQGKVVMIDDCTQDPRVQYPKELAQEGIASLLTVPLSARGQVIGVIRLATETQRSFNDDEIEFFQVAALFCTYAVMHSMFHTILAKVTETIRSSLDLKKVLDSIVTVVTESLRAKGCTIRLAKGRSSNLELRASFGLSQSYLDEASEQPGPAVLEALGGKVVALSDARSDPRIRNTEEVLREKISSILFVPMMSRDHVIGVLSLYTHHVYEFSEDEIHLMTAIGEQCALAIQNAQMYDAIKRKYNDVVEDFHQWFDLYHTYPVQSGD